MHDEVLNDAQRRLLPLMAQFRREYYLVGGTAIALHIGHRRSIDFDMFKLTPINHKKNLDRISAFDDIDSSEAVEYLIGNPPTDEEIKATLTSISLDGV